MNELENLNEYEYEYEISVNEKNERVYYVLLKEDNFIDTIDINKIDNALEVDENIFLKIMQNNVNFYDKERKQFIYKYEEKIISLEEYKDNKLNELESLKSRAENADILYKEKLYQADNKAKELLTQSLVIFSSIGAVPPDFVWKSSDNSLNSFSLDDLKNLSLLIAQRTQAITGKYWAYKEQIRSATTKEELDLIKLEF